jgi:hypothetical protein
MDLISAKLTYNTTSDEDIKNLIYIIQIYKEIKYGWINKWIDE